MRYHYDKPKDYISQYGSVYECNHPVYDKCTLFKINGRGLAVIQQRFDSDKKATFWGPIEPWLNDRIYLHPKFWEYFDSRASTKSPDGLYPTVTIRQIMWALRMRPLPKERWETVFDRKLI